MMSRLLLSMLLMACTRAWELPEFMKEYAAQQAERQPVAKNNSFHTPAVALGVKQNIESLRWLNDNAGTESPTESPAPSPSPSSAPTHSPTVTPKPTATPTETPTESPAPSPSPSSTPTYAPSDLPSVSPTRFPTRQPSQYPSSMPTITPVPTTTPSQYPTLQPTTEPSNFPTLAPSVSLSPSSVPSAEPSSQPSVSPTTSEPSAMPSVSHEPSAAPSAYPSASMQPSAMPTHVDTQKARFTVEFTLETTLNITQASAFERGTEAWVSSFPIPSGVLENVFVRLRTQTVTETDIPLRHRELQVESQVSTVRKDLLIEFEIVATYTGTDPRFNLQEFFSPEFEAHNTLWIRELSNRDDVFRAFIPALVGIEQINQQQREDGTTVGSSVLTVVILSAVVAISVGLAASIYSLHAYRTSEWGEELPSPVESVDARTFEQNSKSKDHLAFASCDASVVQDSPQKSMEIRRDSTVEALSPNTLEKGGACVPVDPLRDVFNFFSRPSQAASKGTTMDPPMSKSFPEREPNYGTTSFNQSHRNETALQSDVPALNKVDEMGKTSELVKDTALQRYPTGPPIRVDNGMESIDGLKDDSKFELRLTKSKGGTLGAAGVNETASDWSSQANSFFANMIGRSKAYAQDGAQNLQPGTANNTKPSLSMLESRAGLYDVFAPAGPIGIVVDTTKDGPSVHSLKQTSPMLGLINPGDLIVALDDIDTRAMTAATLTRLMAQKANQKERKITLLASENL